MTTINVIVVSEAIPMSAIIQMREIEINIVIETNIVAICRKVRNINVSNIDETNTTDSSTATATPTTGEAETFAETAQTISWEVWYWALWGRIMPMISIETMVLRVIKGGDIGEEIIGIAAFGKTALESVFVWNTENVAGSLFRFHAADVTSRPS